MGKVFTWETGKMHRTVPGLDPTMFGASALRRGCARQPNTGRAFSVAEGAGLSRALTRKQRVRSVAIKLSRAHFKKQ